VARLQEQAGKVRAGAKLAVTIVKAQRVEMVRSRIPEAGRSRRPPSDERDRRVESAPMICRSSATFLSAEPVACGLRVRREQAVV